MDYSTLGCVWQVKKFVGVVVAGEIGVTVVAGMAGGTEKFCEKFQKLRVWVGR